ncbi:unnamed protein product [Closterium sp. Naga37s-1]|nr:unnamed protein product [Closterium sp. Naga37s-1]
MLACRWAPASQVGLPCSSSLRNWIADLEALPRSLSYLGLSYPSDLTRSLSASAPFPLPCQAYVGHMSGLRGVGPALPSHHSRIQAPAPRLRNWIADLEALPRSLSVTPGTCTSSLRNWIADLEALPRSLSVTPFRTLSFPFFPANRHIPRARVHRGFYSAYHFTRLRPAVVGVVLFLTTILPSSYRVAFTGHSLGGALATLSALDLQVGGWGFPGRERWVAGVSLVENGEVSYDLPSPDIRVVTFGSPRVSYDLPSPAIRVVTFGSPRVGNAAFAAYFRQKVPGSTRVTNWKDLVPHLPPATIGYHHVATEDPKTENNPYLGFVYTSFQERATFISHGNTARHAKEFGDDRLAVICGMIAADEKRHEKAYCAIVSRLYELDPSGAMLAFEDMMRKQVHFKSHAKSTYASLSLLSHKLPFPFFPLCVSLLSHMLPYPFFPICSGFPSLPYAPISLRSHMCPFPFSPVCAISLLSHMLPFSFSPICSHFPYLPCAPNSLLSRMCPFPFPPVCSHFPSLTSAATSLLSHLLRLPFFPLCIDYHYIFFMQAHINSLTSHLMYDGENPELFDDFSAVAQRTGVYTAGDYADIMEHLIAVWDVEKMEGLSPEAARAQEFVCKLPPRIRRLAERAADKVKKGGPQTGKFSWVFNREVKLV